MTALTFGEIRVVRPDDTRALDRVAELHVSLLGFGPLSAFGPRMVRDFGYRLPMESGLLQLAVYEAAGDIGGFVATTADPEALYSRAVGRHWPHLAALMAISLFESPRSLRGLARALRIWRSRAPEPEGGSAGLGEVAAIAVSPRYVDIQFVRRHRLRVSEALLDYAIETLRSHGLTRMRGLLDADNPAPQLLYGRRGARFRPFSQAGKDMVEAIIDLR